MRLTSSGIEWEWSRMTAKSNESRSLKGSEVATAKMYQALLELGLDTASNFSTKRTPERFIKYLQEFMQPVDLKNVLGEGFEAVHDHTSIGGMVVQSYIPLSAICEHHLLPFQGNVFIGYIPDKRIVGLSKITRLVWAVSHSKPSLQEAITEQIADALFNEPLDAKGSIVVVRATHGCMSCRGVNTPEVITTTSCIRGLFRDVLSAREEFFQLAGIGAGTAIGAGR